MTHQTEAINNILPERKESAVSSVIVLPEKLEFETQNPNEKVFILLRRDFATNVSWIASTIFLFFVPVLVYFVIQTFQLQVPGVLEIKDEYIIGVIMFWYLLVFTMALMKFLDWYFNIYVVTSERILDFDFNPYAYHRISEAGLESIVDATQESIGFLPMLFNYGDVYIQTAGEKREFDFHSVSKPAWVRDKIMDLRDLMVNTPK